MSVQFVDGGKHQLAELASRRPQLLVNLQSISPNISQAAFAPTFVGEKRHWAIHIIRDDFFGTSRKAHKSYKKNQFSYEKAVGKLLVKLTP